jgi:cytochrome c biogenesis protein CcdA
LENINLIYAFTAGMLATINPCGWAMLPSFVSYYLGSREEGYEHKPLGARLGEGLVLGLLVTAGFLVVFGTAGVVISAGLRAVVQYLPLGAVLVGIGLVLLGFWLLAGKSLPFALPVPEVDVRARNPKSVFLFGLAYGFTSLSCTLPVFLAVVGASLTVSGLAGGAAMFAGYAAGMGSVLMAVALGAALLKGTIIQWFQRFLPYTYRLGALLLIAAGAYLIWFQGRYLPLILAGL